MTSNLQHCQNLASPVGSDLYYSLLFTDTVKKNAIIVLHAFYHELESILDKCSTSEMAMQRLQWWRGELHRIFNNTPEHAVGKALAPLVSTYNLPKDILNALINGIETKVIQYDYENFAALIEDAHRSWSLLAILICHVLGDTSKEAFLLARELGVSWQIIQHVKRLPWNLQKQRNYFPTELLEKYKIEKTQLYKIFSGKKIIPQSFHLMLQEYIAEAEKYYGSAVEQADKNIKKEQLNNLIFTELGLKKIAPLKKKFKQKMYPLNMSPVKKWWVSTRVYYQES